MSVKTNEVGIESDAIDKVAKVAVENIFERVDILLGYNDGSGRSFFHE